MRANRSTKEPAFSASYAQLMVSLEAAVGPFYEVVIAGDSRANDIKEMLKGINSRFIPDKVA